jgi:protein-S-isoprenylcysteine O-methyltransferase Ste14
MNVEEKALSEHFAESYTEYQKRTRRLIPWLY